MTDPDVAARYFIAQGSYLRREGKLVLDSLSKLFLVAEQTPSELNVLLQGQTVMRAYLRSKEHPQSLHVNGAQYDAPYDAATKLLELSGRLD